MITTLGSANLDLIGNVSRLPEPGETVMGSDFASAPGGKGANQTLAARRAGAEIRFFGAVGSDEFAEPALALLKQDGVDLAHLRRWTGPTGIAMIFVDEAGENVIAILPGANGTVTVVDAESALLGLVESSILLLQQEVPQPATRRALELARGQGVISILNTAPFLATTAELAKFASIVVANETEFDLLTGGVSGDLDRLMLDWAAERGQTLVVTLGSDGARAATNGRIIVTPALPITPVDTVGAGDTFCGYLAAGLDAGLPLEHALKRASVAASLACLKPGAQPAIPYARDVDAALS